MATEAGLSPSTSSTSSNLYESLIFHIIIESKSVQTYQTIDEVLLVVFALYYIMNLRYLKSVYLTLEFLQRTFFGVTPTRGTKGKKKTRNTQSENTEEVRPYIVQDAGGETLNLMKISDRIFILMTKEKWDGMKLVEGRQDDVIVTSYPKSGNHYVYEIISMLQRGSSEPIPNVMELNHMEFIFREQVTEIQSPRTMCTHRYSDELPIDMLSKKCKFVQVVRNPKDACVSFYHLLREFKLVDYDGKFTNFIPLYLKGEVPFGGWDEHFLKWKEFKLSNSDYPILTLRYEDLLANPVKGIKKIAKFLEKEYSDKLYEEIAVKTQFDQMKSYKESLQTPLLSYFKGEKEIMYRKGKTGDWKNYFSPSEAEEFDKYYYDKLEEEDYIYLNDS